MGTKVVYVALLATLIVGDRLTPHYRASAGMSADGVALLNAGGPGRGGRRNLGLTVLASLACPWTGVTCPVAVSSGVTAVVTFIACVTG